MGSNRGTKLASKNIGSIIKNFEKILIPEMNNGQLIKVLRDKFLVDAIAYNKIKGMPFTAAEIKNKIVEVLQ